MKEIDLVKANKQLDYRFMDVFELLVLLMIVRREVINFAIRSQKYELLGKSNDEYLHQIMKAYEPILTSK